MRRTGRLALGLALQVALPASSTASDQALVLCVRDASGQGVANTRVVARCPGGNEWTVTTDARGFALMAIAAPCPLPFEFHAPDTPGATFEVERRAAGVVALRDEAWLARDLPSSQNVWSLLETAEPAAILDRIDGAGLFLGEPGRLSMRGASWTQNALVLDGVDVTDPLHGGLPITYPALDSLAAVEVVSALAPVELGTPGVTIGLVSRQPSPAWRGAARVSGLSSSLQAGEGTGATPAIARFGSLLETTAVASGPIARSWRVLGSAHLGRVRRHERNDPADLESRLLAGLGQLVHEPSDRNRFQLLASGQALRRPFAGRALLLGPAAEERADSLGAQIQWTRNGARSTASVFAGYWSGVFGPETHDLNTGRPVERLLHGPLADLVFPASSRRSTGTLGGRLAWRGTRLGGLWHAPRLGVSVVRAAARDRPGTLATVPEKVDGWPARVWEWSWAGADSRRRAREFAAWAAEQVAFRDRLFLEAGLRLDAARGRAEGAAEDISWTSLSPRVTAQLRLTDFGRISVLGGYAEYQHRLWLERLAFGDPNAAQATVRLWNDLNLDGRFEPSERGILVARAGPGAADSMLVTIDPQLRPPRTREFVLGVEATPGQGWVVSLNGFDRRERDLVESVNVGVPLASYSVRYLPDPAGDILGPQDDQLLPVYDRKPESFGLDRYRLTNPAAGTTLHQGVELRVEKAFGADLSVLAGATASRTEIAGAHRGFRATENDQGLVGELHDDPNADTHARGRGFFDRAYTIKLAAAYRAPGDWRVGAVARYQDGQAFGRLVVVRDLAQGPEAVPATPRGQIARGGATDDAGRYVVSSGHRFTYTLTVDARVEKGLRWGDRRLSLGADAFNLLDMRHEVEENAVWGPDFRAPTALQPPRALRLGLRLDF